MLGEHGHVRVVGDVHWHAELRLQPGLQRNIGPPEVGRRAHDAVRVDDTGRADADAEDRGGRLREQSCHEVGDERRRRLAGRIVEGDLGAGDDVAIEADDGADEPLVLGEVDAHDVEGVAVDVDERRGLARSGRRPLTELDDEALGEEAGHEVGDRDLGEPGLARDIRPALRALGVERLQHECPVVAARMLGQHLAGGAERAGAGEDRSVDERRGGRVTTSGAGDARLGDLAAPRFCRHVR